MVKVAVKVAAAPGATVPEAAEIVACASTTPMVVIARLVASGAVLVPWLLAVLLVLAATVELPAVVGAVKANRKLFDKPLPRLVAVGKLMVVTAVVPLPVVTNVVVG